MKVTQCDKVLEYMRRFGSIHKFDALEDIGCKNLAGIITKLRNKGYAIGRRMGHGKDRYGDDLWFAVYYLIEEK
jgi:hypothetical protein